MTRGMGKTRRKATGRKRREKHQIRGGLSGSLCKITKEGKITEPVKQLGRGNREEGGLKVHRHKTESQGGKEGGNGPRTTKKKTPSNRKTKKDITDSHSGNRRTKEGKRGRLKGRERYLDTIISYSTEEGGIDIGEIYQKVSKDGTRGLKTCALEHSQWGGEIDKHHLFRNGLVNE